MENLPTFIVFNKNNIPVAIGEQISSEVARYCASASTGIFYKDLTVEEVNAKDKLSK